MTPRPALAALASIVALVAPLAASSMADATTPAVKISFVRYDSPGPDTGTNASLNAEYVVIKNTTTTARSLTGWTLKDRTGYTYRFPTFTLRAGATVTVHTDKGTATATDRYYNHAWYIWNNTGDTAYLRNGAGTLVHSCAWSSVGVGYRYC